MPSRSPPSAAARVRALRAESGARRPTSEPRVGTNTSAITSEADSVAMRVMGRYFMNSPTTPGQNSRGMNAARVVAVEAMMGQAMRLAATA